MRDSTPAASLIGRVTASSVRFTPSTMRAKSPLCRLTSARACSRPARAASTSVVVSATSILIESMAVLRLFLISLKSPWKWSVIRGGMSPLLMRSTYSAATFSGPITASSVALTPSITSR